MDFLLSRRRGTDSDLRAGRAERSGEPVALSEHQRSTHLYVCGTTGSGKSRWLQNLIFQDVAQGHPVVVLDAMGDLFARLVEFCASGLERAGERGFPVAELAERYLFLDAADPDNPLRLNPLAPTADETVEQQVDDLLRAFERQTGSMEQQQRRRLILRGIFHLTAALNRLPPERRPRSLPGRHAAYPLNLSFAADLLTLSDQERFALLAALPGGTREDFRRLYWEFFAQGSALEKFRQLQSTFTALQYFLDDDVVLRVFDTQRSTFSVSGLLRTGRSLICHLPIGGNLSGAAFLGRFLTTKLQQAAYRRPEAQWSRRCYLYLDEFHLFADAAFAESLTNLRKFGVRVTVAHQSLTQPPFDTDEGRNLLKTIRGNARLQASFRLARADAEIVSRDLFELTQRRENFTAVDAAVSISQQQSSSVARSSGRAEGSGRSWARSRSTGSGEQETFGESGRLRYGVSGQSSHRADRGGSHHAERSTGEQHTQSTTEGRSETRTTRMVYYPLEGERELLTNRLQKLGNRQCYLCLGGLDGLFIETPFVPDALYAYQALNLPAQLLDWQRRRLRRELEETEVADAPTATRVLPFAPSVPVPPRRTDPALPETDDEEAEAAQTQTPGENYPFVD